MLTSHSVKAGSQCDARPCVALILICETLVKNFNDFFAIRPKDATQRNAKIGFESILVLRCIATSINVKTTQRSIWCSVLL